MSSDVGPAESGVVELILTAAREPEILSGFLSELEEEPDHYSILIVSNESTPDQIMSIVGEKLGSKPGEFGLINVGDGTRSTGLQTESSVNPTTILTIVEDQDISRLGTTINLYLNQWEDNDKEIRIYFNSLSNLLETVSLQQLFRFLHLLIFRIREIGAKGQFYLNPKNFDRQTIKTVEPLFDVVAGNADIVAVGDQSGQVGIDELNGDSAESRLRRSVLSFLLEKQTPVELRKLTEWVLDRNIDAVGTPWNGDRDQFDEIYYSLYHIQIPKLVNAGLVVTDQSNELVEETRAANRVASLIRDNEDEP